MFGYSILSCAVRYDTRPDENRFCFCISLAYIHEHNQICSYDNILTNHLPVKFDRSGQRTAMSAVLLHRTSDSPPFRNVTRAFQKPNPT
jgi:hypothetical protein